MKPLVLSILVFTMACISNAQDYTGSFEFDGYERQYEVYLPQDFQDNMPLIVSLHGITETVHSYKTYTEMHEVADTLGYVIVYPQGIEKSWNAGAINPDRYFPDTDDVGFILALIDTMKTKWDIDLSRVYCCGFSLGGRMSFRMAGECGHRFAAIASVSGPLFGLANTWQPIQPIPVLYMHGTKDNLAPYEGKGDWWSAQNTINYWLENNHCTAPADTFSFPDIVPGDGCTIQKISYTSCSGESEVIHYKGINMGHSWPNSKTTFGTEGYKNLDINANVEILNFFKQFENPLVDIAYAKSLEVSPFSIQSLNDTLKVRAKLSNPENHTANVFAVIQGVQFQFIDTLQLFDDGLHSDGDSSDNVWSNTRIVTGLPEDKYEVDLFTYDSTYGNTIGFDSPARFITFGPVAYCNYSFAPGFPYKDSVPFPDARLNLKLTLKNQSSLATATNIATNLASLDTLVSFNNSISSFEDIPAGDSLVSNSKYNILISKECPVGKEIPIEVNISCNGTVCWRDTFSITVQEPIVFIDEVKTHKVRIYPNPTNELLTLETEYPDHYSFEISSLNGQQIHIGEMQGTTNQIDLSTFQNGVYFITIRSTDFVTTRKIIKQ